MLFCGVDIGTTNLKVTLIDGECRVLWTRVVATPRTSDEYGVVTDPDAVLSAVENLIVDGCLSVGAGRQLAAISTTGVGEDGVCLDGELRPLSPAIPWFDGRAKEQANRISRSAGETPKAGIKMDSTRSGAKWLWMQQHQPEVLNQAEHWVAITDYPLIKWSGRPFMSETLAARTGCFDVESRRWISALLKTCAAPPLPEVLRAGAVVGNLSKGPLVEARFGTERTLIVAGGHDHPVAASAIRRIEPDARVDSIGTANVVYGETARTGISGFHPYLSFVPPVRATSGLGCLGVFEFSNAIKPFETALRSVLALSGIPGAPLATDSHGIPDDVLKVRHLLEHACFQARRMFSAMDDLGVPSAPTYVTGGWSRSNSFLRLRASVYGAPITILEEQEPSVVGAALLAAEATGVKTQLISATSTVEPNEEWAKAYFEEFARQNARLERVAAP
jgi:xylulokinase